MAMTNIKQLADFIKPDFNSLFIGEMVSFSIFLNHCICLIKCF